MLQQWMITVGIPISYIVALVIFSAFPASAASVGWRLVLGLGAVLALVGLAFRTQMPESPRWLLRQGRYDDVRKAMAALGAGPGPRALIEVFPVMQNAISLAGVMVVFAGLCALAIVFVWKFLPETKNLPVEEIVRVFERQQPSTPEAA